MQIKNSDFVHEEWYNTEAGISIPKIKYYENTHITHTHTQIKTSEIHSSKYVIHYRYLSVISFRTSQVIGIYGSLTLW